MPTYITLDILAVFVFLRALALLYPCKKTSFRISQVKMEEPVAQVSCVNKTLRIVLALG